MAPSRAGISSLCAGKRHGRAPRSAGKNRRARAAVRGKIDGKKPERRPQSSPPPIPYSSLSLSLLRRPPPASPPPPPALQPVGKKQRAGRQRRGHRRQQRAGAVACNNRGKAAGAGPGVDKAGPGTSLCVASPCGSSAPSRTCPADTSRCAAPRQHLVPARRPHPLAARHLRPTPAACSICFLRPASSEPAATVSRTAED